MAIKFLNTVAVDTDVLYVDTSSNNVGIGTTSPGVKLHVDSSSYGEIAKFGNGNVQLSFGMESTHGYINAQIQGTTFRNLSLNPGGGNVGIGINSPSSKLQVNGDLTVGDDSTVGSWINVIAAGSGQDAGIRFGSESNTDSKAAIYTNTSNSDLHFDVTETTRMLIDSATGNVGIGTTSPSQKLDVAGDATFDGRIYTNATALAGVGILGKAIANGWAARYDSNNANYSGFYFDANNDASMILRDDAGNMNVYLRSDATSYLNGGNVGIGTTSPSQKLDVVGSAQVTNDIYLGRYIFHDGDTDTWLGFPLNDTISFRTNNSDRMYINSSGNVGIGTTSPSYKLDIAGDLRVDNGNIGSTSGDELTHARIQGARHFLDFKEIRTANDTDWRNTTFKLQAGVDSTNHQSIDFVADGSYQEHIDILTGNQVFNTRFTYDGKVGIGTTSPTSKLHVAQDQNNTFSTAIAWTASANDVLNITNNNSTDTNNYASLYMRADGSSGSFSSRIVARNTTAGTGELHFQLRDSAHTANTETKLMIDSGGNVGIGTTSPASKLTIGDISLGATGGLKIEDPSNTAYGAHYSFDDASSTVEIGGVTNNTLNDCISIARDTGRTITIDTNAKVGIGTTSPSYKLDVNGSIASSVSSGFPELRLSDAVSDFLITTNSNGEGIIKTEGTSKNIRFFNNSGETMRISGVGNVGIGTTSPSGRLTIGSGATTDNSTMFNVNGQYNDVGFNGGTSGLLTQGVWSFINSATWDQTRFYVQDQNNVASRLTFDFRGNAGNTNILAGTSTGNVGIGTTSPSSPLHIQKTLSGGQVMAYFDGTVGPSTYGALNVRVDNIDYGTGMRFYRSGTYDSNAIGFINGTSTVGSININTSSTSYNTTSDYRLKENLTEITDGIDRIKQLKPKRFNFIGDTTVVDGFIAHEAKQVVPEAVTGEKDEVLPNGDPVYQGIDQAKIVPLLTAALQEAIAKIEVLENRLQILENK